MPMISGANDRRERSEKGDLTMGENRVILGVMKLNVGRPGRTLEIIVSVLLALFVLFVLVDKLRIFVRLFHE